MSTLEALGVGLRAARAARREHRSARSIARARKLSDTAREHALSVAALGCITAAAWLVAVPLGLLVAGVSFFVLELRVSS